MKAKEARQLGKEIKLQLEDEKVEAAYKIMEFMLLGKPHFVYLI